MTSGVIKGALHVDDIDTIERCVLETGKKTGDTFRNPFGTFTISLDKTFPLLLQKKPKIKDIAKAFGFLGNGFSELGDVVKQCKTDVKESHEV